METRSSSLMNPVNKVKVTVETSSRPDSRMDSSADWSGEEDTETTPISMSDIPAETEVLEVVIEAAEPEVKEEMLGNPGITVEVVSENVSPENTVLGENGETLYKCQQCGFSARKKHYLKQHVDLVHTNHRPFKCPFCDYAGKRSHSLKQHLVVHSHDRPFECPDCNASFRKKAHLTGHMKLHSHHCPLCRVTMTEISKLYHHLRDEHTSQTYACPVCVFATVESCTIIMHMHGHGNPQLYQCTTCSYMAVHEKLIQVHVQTHSPTASYTQQAKWASSRPAILMRCSVCGFTTDKRKDLQAHMLKHIPDDASGTEPDAVKQEPTDIKPVTEGPAAAGKVFKCMLCGFECQEAMRLLVHAGTCRKEAPAVKTEAPSVGSGKPNFTHDPVTGRYRCTLCWYTCEQQRTIKGHIWKHSGHKDIDYPMFQNGPISMYDEPAVATSAPTDLTQPAQPNDSHLEAGKPQPYASVTCRPRRSKSSDDSTVRQVLVQSEPSHQQVVSQAALRRTSLDSQPSPISQTRPVLTKLPDTSRHDDHRYSSIAQNDSQMNSSQSSQLCLQLLRDVLPAIAGNAVPGPRGQVTAELPNGSKVFIMPIKTEGQQAASSQTGTQQLSVPNPLKPSVQVDNEDVVGAAPTGDAPTISELSTILLPTKGALRNPSPINTYNDAKDGHALPPQSASQTSTSVVVSRQTPNIISKRGQKRAADGLLRGEGLIKVACLEPRGVPSQGIPEKPTSLPSQLIPSEPCLALPVPQLSSFPMEEHPQAGLARTGFYTSISQNNEDRSDEKPQADSVTSIKREAGGEVCVKAVQDICERQSPGVMPISTAGDLEVNEQPLDRTDDLEDRITFDDSHDTVEEVVIESSESHSAQCEETLSETCSSSPDSQNTPGDDQDNAVTASPPDKNASIPFGGSKTNQKDIRARVRTTSATSEEMITILSLLKKGPNYNPACPTSGVRPVSDGESPGREESGRDLPEDGDSQSMTASSDLSSETASRKQGICSSLLAVIEQLRERSKMETASEDAVHAGALRKHRSSVEEEDICVDTHPGVERMYTDVGEQYRCRLCHYSSISTSLMRSHMRMHKEKLPFECSLCDYHASSSADLQAHTLRHCKVRTYPCRRCSAVFNYKSQLRAHLRAHERAPLLCRMCTYQTIDPMEYRQHLHSHTLQTADKPAPRPSSPVEAQNLVVTMVQDDLSDASTRYKCETCGLEGSSVEEMDTHIVTHLVDQSQDTDSSCQPRLAVASLVNAEDTKPKLTSLQCELCDFCAVSNRSLKSHMKRHANDARFVQHPLEQYKCRLCGYVCHHLPSLKAHMWRHASHDAYSYEHTNFIINTASTQDDGPADTPAAPDKMGHSLITFRCCQCGYETINKAELNQHMREHMNVIQQTFNITKETSHAGDSESATTVQVEVLPVPDRPDVIPLGQLTTISQ